MIVLKKIEILIEEAGCKQEEFSRYLKEIRIGNKSEKQKKALTNVNKCFLTEETMLSNL